MSTTDAPWHLGRPGGPSGPFWSLVNPAGRVVAMQIPNEGDARLMSVAQEMLECCLGADALISYLLESGTSPTVTVDPPHGNGEDLTVKLLHDIRAVIARTRDCEEMDNG
jgi:hypothetical protein